MRFLIFFLIVGNLWAEFHIVLGSRPKSAIDKLQFHTIRDFYTIPQNTLFYARQIIPFSWQEQLEYSKEYVKKFFYPWGKSKLQYSDKLLYWQIKMVQNRVVYGFNKEPIDKREIFWWIKNSNFANLNSVASYAITTKHTNLRAFPTDKDIYLNPNKNTSYYPFDYNQNSELHLNTPLFLSHYSLDKKWAFVEAAQSFGWLKVSDFAKVDTTFKKQFKSTKFAVSIRDNLYLKNGNRVITLIKLGTLFPMIGTKVAIAKRESNGFAKLVTLNRVSSNIVTQFPYKFAPLNVAYIAQQFVNEPYGWGGKAFCRDCSATTRDFFAPFGIFLMRNSFEQARQGKRVISIKGLPKAIKKSVILSQAKPFRSLLYVPGHIVIYLGRYKNEPIVMHTYWGVRLQNWDKYTLSRTIITTLEPGKELPNIREKSKLINTLQKIINF